MSDEQKDRGRGEEARPRASQASPENAALGSGERSQETQPRQDASAEETETLSLLDLMAEVEREKGKSASRPEATAAADDQATATGPPIPTNLPRPTPKPLPPISRDETITSQPPEKDENATDVQPGLAFPGATDPRFAGRPPEKERPQQSPAQRSMSEQPTEVFHRRPQPQAPPQQAQRPSPQQRAVPQREHPRPRYAVPPAQQPQPAQRPRPAAPRRPGPGCMTRVLLVGLLLLLVGLAMGGAGAVVAYTAIAADLPDDVSSQASHFETAIILDREGNELYSLADPTTGNRTYVTLDQISPHLINATIATEDARFYTNPGFDPVGIARAVVQAAQEREIVSGASTITQQLVRAVVLEEEERTQRTFGRKVREIVLAAELSRTTSKDKILELYLNEIFYGNFAYGIEAAAQGYFGKHAADLTLAEASLLAGLPQAPALYDPYTAPELALGRQAVVLQLMVDAGYITEADAQAAIDESAPVVRNLTPPRRAIEHPHFVFTVLQQLEDLLGAQSLYAGGLRVYTSLDPEVQRLAEAAVAAHRDDIRATGANNAALVALDPDTGEVLALVGSVDYRSEEIKGQVNMALAPRQPGSSIKPLVYASTLEDGWTPSTLIWDVRTEFPDGANPEPYVPKNYDDEFHGPLRLRPALGNSYNVPAVKALEYVGVCAFIRDLRDFGINLEDPGGCDDGEQPRNYGLALALGGGEISPLQMTSAYATLANEGQYIPPFTIRRIENSRGELQFAYEPPPPAPAAERALRPAHAFLLSDILSDNDARQPEFGTDNRLTIAGHEVAAKTGTSGSTRYDVRDGWTIGYTPRIAAGVWVGNTDPNPVKEGMSGYQMAAPIWNDFMRSYLAGKEAVSFTAPEDVVRLEICAASGTRPGPGCSQVIGEYFAADQLPRASEADFVQQVPVDLWTGLVANEFCNEAVYQASFVNLLVSGREEIASRELANARAWIEETAAGQAWANARGIGVPLRLPPTDACGADTPRPRLSLTAPSAGSEIMGETQVRGTAMAPGFAGYVVDFGLSHDPGGWGPVQGLQTQPVQDGILAIWDTTDVSFQGPVTVRLTVFGPDNPYTPEEDRVMAEARLLLTLQQPTPTATPTPTITPTATVTPSPTLEATPTVTGTPPPGGEGGGEGAETTPSP